MSDPLTIQSTINVFRDLWGMIDKKKNTHLIIKYIILVLLALPVETIILPYYLISKISNLSSNNFSIKSLKSLITTFVITFGILKTLGFFRYRIATKLQYQMYTDIKRTMMNDIMSLYKNSQKELPLGRIINHMDNVPFIMEYIINLGIGYLLPEMICLVTIIGFFFYIDVSLGIMTLLFISLYVWWILKRIDVPQRLAKREASYRAKHNQGIMNTLDNMLYILISNSFGFERDNFKKKNDVHLSKLNECERANSNMYKILDFGSIVFLGLISYRLYQLIIRNYKQKLDFVKYTSIFIILVFFMDRLYDFKTMFTEVCTYLHKSRVFLEDLKLMKMEDRLPNTTVEEEEGLPYQELDRKQEYSIILKNLSYQYPGSNYQVLKQKTLYFPKNKMIAIQGPSGCGKTTLAKIILGLLNPHKGRILVEGENLTHQFALRQHKVGFIPQQVKLFEGTILDNIRYSCRNNISPEKVKRWVEQQGVASILKSKKGDSDYLNRNVGISGSELSGGQRQLIIILRTFLSNICSPQRKKVYILDEPTSALDPQTTNIVLNLLKKHTREFTIIIITHDTEVAKKCDQAIFLKPLSSNN
jgi:ABC-type multidrug transport system fused ATPase/permease subunit